MNKVIKIFFAIVVLAAILVLSGAVYILPEGKQAVITRFGAPKAVETEAGLKFKMPIFDVVQYFEKRILIWDGDPNQIPTNDKTFVYLDVTARWRIVDALLFLQAVNNENRAQTILDDIIDGTVRDLVNKNDLIEIIRSSDWSSDTMSKIGSRAELEQVKFGRDKITAMIHEQASKVTPQYGIELVDVMFKRVNYIDTVRQKVYDRMISERKRIAAELRSQGEGQKAEIMGKLQRDLKEITSTAQREAQEIKGKADAEAAAIFAAAYNKDPEFYAFSKTLETYKDTLGENSRLIISSDSPVYKYLKELK